MAEVAENVVDKKNLLKKRQTKLMQKMKKKGTKYLQQSKQKKDDEPEMAGKEEEEVHQCSFCQEELRQENFAKDPFGTFSYCQATKVYFHSVQQTVRAQK